MIEYDVPALLRDHLRGENRPPDGLLHPSGDLIGSLRHSQLRAAGAPTIESDLTSDVRLMTGTMWHALFETLFRKKKKLVATEVSLDRYLPEGWSGTADWIAWSDKYRAFDLGDLKTIKGEGMAYVNRDGIKLEHMWQLSAYWYALENMGLPLVKRFCVLYLPMNVPQASDPVEPRMHEGKPLDRELVLGTMADRWKATKRYLAGLDYQRAAAMSSSPAPKFSYDTSDLAPVQDRVQALRWSKQSGVFDVKLIPHWSAAFCPFPDELCDCSTQGQTKIGHYTLDGTYVPRKGYEEVAPTVEPTPAQLRSKRQEEDGGKE